METPKKKHFWQKICVGLAALCFVAGAICMGILFFYNAELTQVYRASFGASAFFFGCVAVVLQVIGSTNLPDFSGKTPPSSSESTQD